MASFTKKTLSVTLVLGTGTLGANLGNALTVEGLRTLVSVEKGGHPSKNKAQLKLYGLTQDHMNAFTTPAFHPLAVRRNLLKIVAVETDARGVRTESIVFAGEITSAYACYQEAPDLYFHVEAMSGYYPALTPSAPRGFSGGASVQQVMGELASAMNYAFENNGVDQQIETPYLWGSAFQQAGQLAAAAGIEFGVDDETVFIAPRGGARRVEAPLVSKETGLKEYPIFDKRGIRFDCLYTHGLVLGGVVKVESVVPNANRLWRVIALRHKLEAIHDGGSWLSRVEATYLGGTA